MPVKYKQEITKYFGNITEVLHENESCKFENYQLSQVKNMEDGNIFLLHDSIEKSEFDSLVNGYEKDKLYILYHSRQEKEGLDFSEFPHEKKGQHGDEDDAYCFFCKKIVELKDTDKSIDIDEIIEAVFGFDARVGLGLDFLHNHFKGSAIKKEIELLLEKVKNNDSEIERNMIELFNDSKEIDNDKCITSFNELRNIVFKLVKNI